jgi:hypothetical protein
MTIRQIPIGRDYFRYPIWIADGANKVKYGAVTVEVPEGWYYNCTSADANFPGLWTTITDLYAAAAVTLTFGVATPTLSTNQVSCGFTATGLAATLDLSIAEAMPYRVWGATTNTFSIPYTSELNIPGIYRVDSLTGGIASIKDVMDRFNGVFKSHDAPNARFTRWEQFQVVDLKYEAVPALFVKRDRAQHMDYLAGRNVWTNDDYVAFERMFDSMTLGLDVIMHGDVTSSLSANLYDGTALRLFEPASDVSDIARRESVSFERYSLEWRSYVATTQPAAP